MDRRGGPVRGRVFLAINKVGKIWGDGMTPKVIRELVKAAAARANIERLAPHELRRRKTSTAANSWELEAELAVVAQILSACERG